MTTTQPVITREQKSSLSDAQIVQLSTAIKEAVENAFTKGLLEAHSRIFSGLNNEIRNNQTLFGFTVTTPEDKTADEIEKDLHTRVGESFNHCRKEVSDKEGVRVTREWFAKRVYQSDGQAPPSSNIEPRPQINNTQAQVLIQNATTVPNTRQSANGYKTPGLNSKVTTPNTTKRNSGKSQSGKGRKKASADYTLGEVKGEYVYEGVNHVSYKCSDGHIRILSPTQVQELERHQQSQVPGMPGPTQTPSKRKPGSNIQRNSASKKTKLSHPSDQSFVGQVVGPSGHMQPLALPIPVAPTQTATRGAAPAAKFQAYMDNLADVSNVAGISPPTQVQAVSTSNEEDNMAQTIEHTSSSAPVSSG